MNLQMPEELHMYHRWLALPASAGEKTVYRLDRVTVPVAMQVGKYSVGTLTDYCRREGRRLSLCTDHHASLSVKEGRTIGYRLSVIGYETLALYLLTTGCLPPPSFALTGVAHAH